MKLKLILSMLLPLMNLGITSLREKDENSTGFDDAAADQLETALNTLQKYIQS